MVFAHWKKILVASSRLLNPLAGNEHIRNPEAESSEIAEHFILDIPAGMQREEAVDALRRKLLPHNVQEECEGMGFEEEWPAEVLRQFQAGLGERWQWPVLE
jgi:hypothetical protein